METRSNRYLVGAVLTLLIVWLAAYVFWASPGSGHRKRQYDIFFDRSVAGLEERSPVTLAGVTVGRVRKIRFDPGNPELVRVRIAILDPKAPILQGIQASLKHDLFGTATITLDGATGGAPPILPTRYGEIPVIPAKKGSGMFGDPVSIVETLSRTTERLNQMLSPAGQRSITQEITDLEKKSRTLADHAPALADQLARTDSSIREGTRMAAAMGEKADAMERRIQAMRGTRATEIRESLRSTRENLARFDQSAAAARPMARNLAEPALTEQVHELRGTVSGLSAGLGKIEEGGLGPAAAPSKLPDYEGRR